MKSFRIVWAVLFALLISLGGSAPTLISLRQLSTTGTASTTTFLRGGGAWTTAAQLGTGNIQTFQGQITGPSFVGGNFQVYNGSSTYNTGLAAENYGGGMLLDFGANYSQLGGAVDANMFGSYFRIDTRDALASEMFSITAIPSGTGTGSSREQKIFEVNRTGDIFSTTNAYQVLTTNSALNGAKVTDPVTTLAANYTATGSDSVLLSNAASGAFTVTLPSATTMTGETLLVKKIDATTNAVTLATTSSQTIDGLTTYAMNTQNAAVSVTSDGSNWRITMLATAGSQLNIYGGPASSGSFTWTKPSWAKLVRVVVVGQGSGGGSGRRGAMVTARSGGSGGSGGSINEATFLASLLTATVPVVVQPGGAGGAAVTTDSTSGNSGATISASLTSFGTYPLAVRVFGANAGVGGTAAVTSGAASISNLYTGGTGGSTSVTAAASVVSAAARAASGGGAGGSMTTGDVIVAGSNGAGPRPSCTGGHGPERRRRVRWHYGRGGRGGRHGQRGRCGLRRSWWRWRRSIQDGDRRRPRRKRRVAWRWRWWWRGEPGRDRAEWGWRNGRQRRGVRV